MKEEYLSMETVEKLAKCDDLQKRINTAIEYIHNHQLVFELSNKKQIQKWFNEFYAELLSILRGKTNE